MESYKPHKFKGHKNVSVRLEDYRYMLEYAGLLQVRDSKPWSLCDVVHLALTNLPNVEVQAYKLRKKS
jgi:hypothetical protein